MENTKLLAARARKQWTVKNVCDATGISEKTYRRCEHATHKPHYYTIAALCQAFNASAEDLGLIYDDSSIPVDDSDTDTSSVTSSTSDVVTLPRNQVDTIIHMLQLGDTEMTKFDPSRRKAIVRALIAASTVVTTPQLLANHESWEQLARSTTQPRSISQDTLEHFSQLIDDLWKLNNVSEIETVQRILPTFLPQLATMARQSSKHQEYAAKIASQGYILAAEVEKSSVSAMEKYSELASHYGNIANDYSTQVAAFKQQATIALIADKPIEALEYYKQALPLLPFVSTLLQTRIYMGMASSFARISEKNANLALKYMDLAKETFPSSPETDLNFLYIVCTKPVLHLYDGLTQIDLKDYNQAWNALDQVDGIHPKLHVPESWRIEFINAQAKTATHLGDLERSTTYIKAGIEASKNQGYNIWTSEAYDVLQEIKQQWPTEQRTKELTEMLIG